jgi:hypothetical protein
MQKEYKYNVSICTAIRNKDLATVTDTLSNQSLDKNLWEMVIVDMGSNKKLDLNKCNFNCTYIYVDSRPEWTEFGRNAAVANSHGRFICTIHPDLLFSYNFVECLNKYFDNDNVIINVPRWDVTEFCYRYIKLLLTCNYFEQDQYFVFRRGAYL